jgi:GPH family glycoside/pentoside/hexuronide:cation symporter
LNKSSYPNFGVFCAIMGTSAMLLCVFGTRSFIPNLRKPSPHDGEGRVWLAFIDVFRTLKLHSFRVLFISVLIFNTLVGVVQTLLVYVATYVFDFQPQHLAGLASSIVLGIVFASVTAQYLSRRFDKKFALALCVITGGAFAFSPQVLYFTGLLESMSDTTKFTFIFSVNGVSQIFFIAYIILLDSMLSDVIDEHELNTGKREEGLFFAARSFATKASYGLGSFFAGIGLDIIHFPQGASPDTVPAEAVLSLAIMSGPLMLVLFAATVIVSSRYPLTAKKHGVIMAAIVARARLTN